MNTSNVLRVYGTNYTVQNDAAPVVPGDNQFLRQSVTVPIQASFMPNPAMRMPYTDFGYNNFIFVDIEANHLNILEQHLRDIYLNDPANRPFFSVPGAFYSMNIFLRSRNPFAVDQDDANAQGAPPLIRVYTELRNNPASVIDRLKRKIARLMDIYNLTTCWIQSPLTVYRYLAPQVGMGSVFRSYARANDVWVRCVTASRTDCLYTAAATAHRARIDATVVFDPLKQQQAGWNLKRRMRAKGYVLPETYGSSEQLKDIARHTKLRHILYNNIFEKVIDFTPEDAIELPGNHATIELHISNAHFSPLIRRSRLTNAQLAIVQQQEDKLKERELSLAGLVSQPQRTITDADLEKIAVQRSKPIIPRSEQVERARAAQRDVDGTEMLERQFEPNDIVAWDLETSRLLLDADGVNRPENATIHKAYAAGLAFDRNGQQQYVSFWGLDCIHQFLDYLYQNLSFFAGKTFYAHSGSRFDISLLLREGVLDMHWNCPFKLVGGDRAIELNGNWIHLEMTPACQGAEEIEPVERPAKRPRKRDQPLLVFHDSYRIMPASLDKLTKELKVAHPKLTETIKHDDITLANFMDEPRIQDLRRYLENDCRGLLEVLQSYGRGIQSKLKVDITRCFTAASVAKRAFWTNFYDLKRPIYHLEDTI